MANTSALLSALLACRAEKTYCTQAVSADNIQAAADLLRKTADCTTPDFHALKNSVSYTRSTERYHRRRPHIPCRLYSGSPDLKE